MATDPALARPHDDGRRRLAHRRRHGRHLHRPGRGLARRRGPPAQGQLHPVAAIRRPSSRRWSARTWTWAVELGYFALGTTIATNAVLQRAGARTIFITTEGFEDNLYIQRIDRKGLYDLQWVKARPYALRHDTIGVSGAHPRLMGACARRLRTHEVERVVEAVAGEARRGLRTRPSPISFLFSYVNPAHERRLAAALREAFPAVPGVASPARWRPSGASTSAARPRSWTPTSSPSWRDSPADLEQGLADRAHQRLARAHEVQRRPGARAACRRPAQRDGALRAWPAGMIAGNHWARAVGSDKAVTLDMGGTSADVGVVVDGQLKFSGLFEVEFGIPIALPIIDVTTIGAGGSSIASHRLRRPAARSGPRARAPNRDRPAMAWAARSPPSPTPTWSSAGSIRTTSWAARSPWTHRCAGRAIEPLAGAAGPDRRGRRRRHHQRVHREHGRALCGS